MKKIIFFVTLFTFFLGVTSSQAQKFGYIDSEFILSKMPDYKKAQGDLDNYSDKWLKEIQSKISEVEKMKLQYQQEEILLTADMKRERQKTIEEKENAVRELQNKVFGVDGLLFQKKKELMKPVMDDIFLACQKIARQKQLMFIFDKAGDISMIYTDPRHDYTDYVLEELGLNKEDKTAKTPAESSTKPKN